MTYLPDKADILVVDDTPANLRLLSSMLADAGCKVRSVINGSMALKAIAADPPDLILLDINMPDMNGYEVCEQIKALDEVHEIPVIFISALDEVNDKVKAFATGGVDYITKPFQIEEVLARVRTHLALRRAQQELAEARNQLLEINRSLERRVMQQVKQISSSHMLAIFALAKLADSRDSDTGQHLERVDIYTRILTRQVSLQPAYQEEIDNLYIDNLAAASALHDIGKVGIPDRVLLAPRKLTPEEFDLMKTHTLIGARALREVDEKFPGNRLIQVGIEIAESHHEKWDGSGYPNGLAGEKIPLAARILALVDVYDALTSPRPYKAAFTHESSIEIIFSERGRQFDPQVVDCFAQVETEFRKVRESLT